MNILVNSRQSSSTISSRLYCYSYSRSRRLTDSVLHARPIESIIQYAIKYIRQTFIDHRSIPILARCNYQGK